MFHHLRTVLRRGPTALGRRAVVSMTSIRSRRKVLGVLAGVGAIAYLTLPTRQAEEQPGPTALTPSPDPKYRFPTDKLKKAANPDKEKIVLVACGSFNPITNMHLRLFEMAKDHFESFGHEVLGGYVSPVSSGYGKKGLLSNEARLEMCKLAVDSSDWLSVDSWETTFPTWTRTYEVLQHFHIEANKRNVGVPVRVVLVCGSDLLDSFNTPGLWSDEDMRNILKSHGVACVSREGSAPESIVYQNDLLYELRSNIHLLPQYIPNDMSSTRIRRALSRGMSVKYLLPDSVVDYIKKNNLYKK